MKESLIAELFIIMFIIGIILSVIEPIYAIINNAPECVLSNDIITCTQVKLNRGTN